MSKGTDHIAELARPALAPGEELLCTARVNYNGTARPNAVSITAVIPGIDLEEAAAPLPEPDPDAVVGFPSANQMGMALTGGRLFLWALGMTGKPKSYLGEVPLSAIREVHAGEVRLGAVLRIVMKSGAVVDLEFLRGEAAEPFVEAITALVGTGG